MGLNYSAEKAKFDREHKKMHDEYIAAGVSEEQWAEIYKFDWEQFNCDIKQRRYVIPLEPENDNLEDADDSNNPLFGQYSDCLSVTIDDEPDKDEFWWIEELSNPDLAKRCRDLSYDEKKLLSLRYCKAMNEEDIAKELGTYQVNVSRRLAKIIKELKKI